MEDAERPQTEPAAQPKDYNAVLEYYVEENDSGIDLVGLVAYALYKRHKRDWIISHRQAHANSKPNDDQVDAVVTSYLTTDLRNTLRERASDLLSSYAETYVEALEPEIRSQAVNNETLRQARDIERAIKQNSGFWRQVGTGLIATAIWTLLITVLVLAGLFFGSDLIDTWRAVNNAAN